MKVLEIHYYDDAQGYVYNGKINKHVFFKKRGERMALFIAQTIRISLVKSLFPACLHLCSVTSMRPPPVMYF